MFLNILSIFDFVIVLFGDFYFDGVRGNALEECLKLGVIVVHFLVGDVVVVVVFGVF